MNTIKKVQLKKGGNRVLFARVAQQRYGFNPPRDVYYVVNGAAYNYYKEAVVQIAI